MDSGGGAATEGSRQVMAEEEALKRRTDCVYFLASPLTCKKGSECEYRHNEAARLNPRDCWYWLNGECLNPKCAFRHPPLDPHFGVPEAKMGSTQPPYAPFQGAYGPSAYSMNKQNVPCYYFQKGRCLKGDKCPFMHGSSTAGNTNPPHAATISSPVSDPTSTDKNEMLVKECTSQQNLSKESANKREMTSLLAKPVVIKSEPNGSVMVQNASSYPSQCEHPPFELNSLQHSWSQNIQSPSVDEHLQTGREVDEFLVESSPGFDVLVDDHVEDPDYFQNEEEYGQAPVKSGRNLKPSDDFDYQHSDFEHVSRFAGENFTEGRGYDRYGRPHDPYAREQLRISSERGRERSLTPEKRKFDTNRIDESDLRHRLKQRRLNSRRPVVSPDRHPSHSRVNLDLHEQRSRVGHSSREYRSVQKEGSVSSRLHGRLSHSVRSEIEINGERSQNRSSTGRPINYQGRKQERAKNRQTEDMNYGAKKYNSQTSRREADPLDFAGPKSLAELKCSKVFGVSQDQKELASMGFQDSEDSLSFEGPKPLSVILKKKNDTAYVNGSCDSDERNHRDSGHINLPFDGKLQHAFEAEDGNAVMDPEARRVTKVDQDKEEGMVQEENMGDKIEVDGVIVDGVDYHEAQNDQGDGEFDYEEADGEELKPEDDELYQEDAEEDEEDDFSKKAGFMSP